MKFNKEIKIGFLAIIGIMMSVFSYNYLKGINLFEKNRKFKVTYSKVDGLSVSNPVTLNGFKIGKVNKINFNPKNTKELIVDIVIENDVIFPKSSKAELYETGLIGGKAIAIIPNCAATRHVHFVLDGSGPAKFDAPDLNDWPEIVWEADETVRRVNLDSVTQSDIDQWQPGETLLLSGKMLTGRDAAHKKMTDMLARGEQLPVDLKGRFIYYVGPVDPVRDEVMGPAGPTTATRMDKFTRTMLEQTGLMGMIGKAERGQQGIEAIKDNQSVYLIAVGGAAYLVSKAIVSAEVVAFPELGMEAIYEFEVVDMPVTVAVNTQGESVHINGPKLWQAKIEEKVIQVK